MSKEKEIRYYVSESDDFFQVGEKYELSSDYEYIQRGRLARIGSSVLYFFAFIISSVYCRLFLRVRFVGAKKLRLQTGGFFIYGNHTQPVGDVFDPALACAPKRIYTVVSVANMHLPVIGRLLRPLGALPLPSTLSQTKRFNSAIRERIESGHPVVIYPEAHLWEYYSGIREFSDASFTYPVSLEVPSYTLTLTYQERGEGKKPDITAFVDGPFYGEGASRRERMRDLHDKVYGAMRERAESYTSCEYIKYVKRDI